MWNGIVRRPRMDKFSLSTDVFIGHVSISANVPINIYGAVRILIHMVSSKWCYYSDYDVKLVV